MPNLSKEDAKAIAGLAARINETIPNGTPEWMATGAALSFLCAVASTSPLVNTIAGLMHAAADELLKGEAGFRPTH